MKTTVNLRANFKADLIDLSRSELSRRWGSQVDSIKDSDIVMAWLDARRRRPEARPRSLRVADDFNCPPDHEAGWQALQSEIAQGIELRPRMSRRHSQLGYLDGLLNEWDVHHFHLGTKFEDDGSGLMKRTGPVVFARVTSDNFYAINTFSHSSGQQTRVWEQKCILETLHRNWPESIRQYRLNGISDEPLTNPERRNIREVNLQTVTGVSDGTVYSAIGGGVTGSGVAMTARMGADMLESDVERLQPAIEAGFANFIPHLREHGYDGELELSASLTNITDSGFQVDFPELVVGFNINLLGGWFHRNRSS